jgi:hypothetical protein
MAHKGSTYGPYYSQNEAIAQMHALQRMTHNPDTKYRIVHRRGKWFVEGYGNG